MKNFKQLVLVFAAALALTVTTAGAESLSYNNVSVGVGHNNTMDSVGVFVRGSKEVTDTVFVFGEYSYDHKNDFDLGLNQVRFGVGGHMSVAVDTDVYGTVYGLYQSIVHDYTTRLADTWGGGVEGGVRTRVNDFEFKVGASHEWYSSNGQDTFLVAGVAYNVTDFVAVVSDVRHDLSGAYQASAGVRFNF